MIESPPRVFILALAELQALADCFLARLMISIKVRYYTLLVERYAPPTTRAALRQSSDPHTAAKNRSVSINPIVTWRGYRYRVEARDGIDHQLKLRTPSPLHFWVPRHLDFELLSIVRIGTNVSPDSLRWPPIFFSTQS